MRKVMEFMFDGDEGFTDNGAKIGAVVLFVIFVVACSIEGLPV